MPYLFLPRVLTDFVAIEQPIDARRFLERLVFPEPEVGRVAKIERLRDFGADVFLVARQRLDDRLQSLPPSGMT